MENKKKSQKGQPKKKINSQQNSQKETLLKFGDYDQEYFENKKLSKKDIKYLQFIKQNSELNQNNQKTPKRKNNSFSQNNENNHNFKQNDIQNIKHKKNSLNSQNYNCTQLHEQEKNLICLIHQKKAVYVCCHPACYNRLICDQCSKKHNENHYSSIKNVEYFTHQMKKNLNKNVELKLQDIEEKFSYLKENSTKQQETIIKEFSDSLDKIQQQIFNYIQKFKEKFILEIKREYSPLQINIDTIINKLNKYQQNINDFNIAEQQNQEEQNNLQENIISSNKKEENSDTKKTKQRKISNTYLSQHNIIKLDKNLVTYLLPNYQRCYDQLKCLLELKKNNYRQIKIGCFEILDKKLKKPLKEIIEELISDNNINSQNNQSSNLSFHQDMENLTPLDINQKQLQNIQENKNNIHKMAFQLINPQINQESIFYFNPLTTINLEEISINNLNNNNQNQQQQLQLQQIQQNQIKFLQKGHQSDLLYIQNNQLKCINTQSYKLEIQQIFNLTSTCTKMKLDKKRKVILGQINGEIQIYDLLKKKIKHIIETVPKVNQTLQFQNIKAYSVDEILCSKNYIYSINQIGFLSKINKITGKIEKQSIIPQYFDDFNIEKFKSIIIDHQNLIILYGLKTVKIYNLNTLQIIKTYQSIFSQNNEKKDEYFYLNTIQQVSQNIFTQKQHYDDTLNNSFQSNSKINEKELQPNNININNNKNKNINKDKDKDKQIIYRKTKNQNLNTYIQIIYNNKIVTCNILTGKVITKTQIKEIDPSICDIQSVNDNATLLILTSKNELLWFNYLSNQIIGLKQLQGKKSYLRYITYMKDGNRVTLSQKESNKIKICQFSN